MPAPMPIGALFAQSGPLAAPERAQLQGFILGVAAVNNAGGIHGRELVPMLVDTRSDLNHTIRQAEILMATGKIRHLFGCSDSSARKALVSRLERRNAMLWYATQFEGFEYSPNVIYGGACPNQHIAPLLDYLLGMGCGRLMLVGSDYVFSHECNRVARQLVTAAGGSISDEFYLPLDADDRTVASILGDFDRHIDAVLITAVGPSATRLCHRLSAEGLHVPIAGIATSEVDLSAAPDALASIITAAPYFETVQDRSNLRFLSAFRHRYGADSPVSWLVVHTYTQVLQFADAVERSSSDVVDDVRPNIGRSDLDSPFGMCRIDTDNHYLHCRPRIGVANRRGWFDIVYESAKAVMPDPYMISYA